MDAAPQSTIEIHQTERHDIREEEIERVARLLCRADGCDPEADLRCSKWKPGDTTITCNTVGMAYPPYLGWNAYRDRAETLLKQLFAK